MKLITASAISPEGCPTAPCNFCGRGVFALVEARAELAAPTAALRSFQKMRICGECVRKAVALLEVVAVGEPAPCPACKQTVLRPGASEPQIHFGAVGPGWVCSGSYPALRHMRKPEGEPTK